MIEVRTALGWRRTIQQAQRGDFTAEEIEEAINLEGEEYDWNRAIVSALRVMIPMFTDTIDERLGQPTGKTAQREDGAYERKFENGIAVFVPGFSLNVRFVCDDPKVDTIVPSPGGEIFLRESD